MALEEQAVEEQQAPEQNEVERKARATGWKPKEEWDGPEDKWREAADYVDFGERVTKVVKTQRDELARELAEVKRQTASLKAAQEKIFSDALARQKAEFDAQLSFLKTHRRTALEKGDTGTAAALEDQIDELREKQQKQPEPQRGPTAAEVQAQQAAAIATYQAWAESNPWIESDPVLGKYAMGVATRLRDSGDTRQGLAFFKAIEEDVKEAFPEKFSRRRAPSVEGAGGNGAPRRGSDYTYATLPADAKAACDELVKDKVLTRDEYLKSYNDAERKARASR